MSTAKMLRSDTLARRNALADNDIAEKSRHIMKRLLEMEQIKNVQTLFVYVSFRSEVATLELIDTLITMGKTVTVPITRVEERRLDAVKIKDRVQDLVAGYCGIPEPPEELCRKAEVTPEEIELIILPGSVFDKRGGRFGYGGGFYDKFVSQIPGAIRIGLAFDLQIVKHAPLAPHDELLDFVVTETNIFQGEHRQIP